MKGHYFKQLKHLSVNLDGKAYEKMTRSLPLCQILDCLSILREPDPAKVGGGELIDITYLPLHEK